MKKFIGVSVLSLPALLAHADELDLEGGATLVGILRSEWDKNLTFELGTGTVNVPRRIVRAIRKGPSALSEYYEKAEAIKASRDPFVHYELGLWARSRGLPLAARTRFKLVLVLDPNHAGAKQELIVSPPPVPRSTPLQPPQVIVVQQAQSERRYEPAYGWSFFGAPQQNVPARSWARPRMPPWPY